MKYLILIFILTIGITSCNSGSQPQVSELDSAQEAFEHGSFARSQQICDSLLSSDQFDDLNVKQLCRLSLLFMKLGENAGNEDVNTAMAARCISIAISRNSDSAALIIREMPTEDQARIDILTQLNESLRAMSADSVYIPADSIPEYDF